MYSWLVGSSTVVAQQAKGQSARLTDVLEKALRSPHTTTNRRARPKFSFWITMQDQSFFLDNSARPKLTRDHEKPLFVLHCNCGNIAVQS